jgi:thiamine biosynthesis lipoprotein
MFKRITALFLILSLLLSGCSGSVKKSTATIFAMDTVMELTVYGGDTDEAQALIYELESELSVTDESSEIYAINRDGCGTVSDSAAELISQTLELCAATDGALDISMYPIVRAWGFTTGNYRVPEDDEIAALLENVGYENITLDSSTVTLSPGMEIDLGSTAKGYAGRRVAELLRDSGVTSALLNLGGNVQTVGAKPDGSPWRVAVQDPQSDGLLGTIEVTDMAVITSGGYERYFEENGETYWHIMDPATGRPAKSGLLSVTIVGSDGLLCDGLSTALFVMGADKGAELWRQRGDFEAIMVTEDGDILITAGLADSFTLSDGYAGEVTVIK